MKVIQVIPKFALAGAEIMCETLSVELIKLGVETVIVSLYDYHSPITDRLEKQGAKIYYLNKKPGFDPRMVTRLFQVFKTEKPDVVHTHLYVMPYVIPAAVMAGVKKRIHTIHSVANKDASSTVQKFNYLFFHCNRVIPVAISKEVQSTVQKLYKLPADRVPLIYNGINLNRRIVKTSYEQNPKLRYIHVGRFAEPKNHDLLIDAFAKVHQKLADTELYLVGEGELEEQIRKKVENLNLSDSVFFMGVTDNTFLLLNQADVFVFPSKWEGLGLALIEAMSVGLPIIATNTGGIPNFVENEKNGLLIDARMDQLTDAMLRMTDKTLRKELGMAAKTKIETFFSSQVMTEKYYELYKNKEI